MKHNNLIIPSGELKLADLRTPPRMVVVECQLVTNAPSLGGIHLVMAENKLAREFLAFELSARALDTELVATVQGWLFSAQGQARVIAEQAYFHVSTEMRTQAVKILRSLPEPMTALPELISFNGTAIKTREALKDVRFVSGGKKRTVCPEE